MNISAVVLTKNEEGNIAECLRRLTWCDEVIVIDDYSHDKTKEIAQKYHAKVYQRALAENFSEQRNFAFQQTKGEWVLFIDADERISPELQKEIQDVILPENDSREMKGYFLKRVDFLWGRKIQYGEIGNVQLLRLVKRDSGNWVGNVHERLNVLGEVWTLQHPLYHYPHQTIKEFLEEINYYTDLRAKELWKQGIKANFISIIIYPKAKFIQNYFFRFGFRDGVPGLVIAIMMSFHSFLVRGKLWTLWQKK